MTWSRFTGNTECTYKRSRSEFHLQGELIGIRVPGENHKPSSRTLLPTAAGGQQESLVNPGKHGVSLEPCWMELSTSKGRDHRLTEVQLFQSRETFPALHSPLPAVPVEELPAVPVEEPSSGPPPFPPGDPIHTQPWRLPSLENPCRMERSY